MTIHSRLAALVLLVLSSLTNLKGADLTSEIDRIAKFYHEQYQFNGTVLVSRAGEVVFRRAYGLADREWNIPHTTDTRFRVGSISKQFTAALILQLVAEGKVELDAPLSRYVPEYPAKVADKVTVHHLLTHTSGIKSYTSMPSFGRDVSRDPYKPLDFLKIFADEPLDFEPGAKYLYNNSGYFLLGVIIEKATGSSYAEALSKRIFEPLRMTGSGYDRAEPLIEKRAEGYEARLDGYRNAAYLDMSLPYSAGSLYSTVEDLYLWDRALAGGKVLSPEMSRKMFEPHVAVSKDDPKAGSYGYGWVLSEMDKPGEAGRKLHVVSHGGGINGFNTLLQRIPADDHLVVLLNNSPGANLGQMAENIWRVVYGEPVGTLKKSSALELYTVYKKDGVPAATERWEVIGKAEDYESGLPEVARFLRGVAEISPSDARVLLEQSDSPKNPQTARLWMGIGDAFAAKSLRDEAAKALGTALEIAPELAEPIAAKLKDLPKKPL